MFSLTLKAFVIFIFLLFQSDLYIFLAHGKALKNSIHIFKTPPAVFYAPYG